MSKPIVIGILDPASRARAFAIHLGAVRLTDAPRVGGKAAHLGEMLAAGLPVPAGFVVTTDACNLFMQSDPRIEDWLRGLEKHELREPVSLRVAAEELREKLGVIPVPGDVAEAIEAALAETPSAAWAVRSSGTLEDLPEASFAGQHDSFLNVRGNEAVVAAVKRCWLSLFTDRALAYRARKGLAATRARMAVIVQHFIAADAAGVMFTLSSGNGDSGSILIEAAFGLGEALVQGKVTPDRVVVSRSGLRVVKRETASKRMEIVAGKDGVTERLIAAHHAVAPVLEDGAALRLARLGLDAERLLARVSSGAAGRDPGRDAHDVSRALNGSRDLPAPLDVEWAVRDGEIWLLQARAVTVLPPPPSGQSASALTPNETSFEDRQVWTNVNAGENFPDVVSPMTWSLVSLIFSECIKRTKLMAGVQVRVDQWIGLVAGRAYFNFNTFCALGRLVPGSGKQRLDEWLGGRQDALLQLKKIDIAQADLPRLRINPWRAARRLPALVFRFAFHSTRRENKAMDSFRQANDELARIDPASHSDDALLAAIRFASLSEFVRNINILDTCFVGLAYTALFFKLHEHWFGPALRSTADRLFAGVGELASAAAGHDLWRLAEQAAAEPEIKTHLREARTFEAFASRLENCRGGPALLAGWNTFMRRHGHHAHGELEVLNSRWSEEPDFVLALLRGYVDAINAGHSSPLARQNALADERAAVTKECVRGLGNPLKRAVFRLVLRRAQRGARLRENLKSEAIRWVAILRRLLLQFGRRLAERGRLADRNDIFFLEIGELLNGSLWDSGTDLRALVASRRAEYDRNSKLSPPPVVVGRFDPRAFVPEAVDHATKVFHGLGVSAGSVTGRARVILRCDAHERVQPGEILVAPFTDPGWTPYFIAVAGIVMDTGGILSHGSILAREYGIPAVVNVGPATQIIRTGQWLEVDADCGLVKLLDTEPQSGGKLTKTSGVTS